MSVKIYSKRLRTLKFEISLRFFTQELPIIIISEMILILILNEKNVKCSEKIILKLMKIHSSTISRYVSASIRSESVLRRGVIPPPIFPRVEKAK